MTDINTMKRQTPNYSPYRPPDKKTELSIFKTTLYTSYTSNTGINRKQENEGGGHLNLDLNDKGALRMPGGSLSGRSVLIGLVYGALRLKNTIQVLVHIRVGRRVSRSRSTSSSAHPLLHLTNVVPYMRLQLRHEHMRPAEFVFEVFFQLCHL